MTDRVRHRAQFPVQRTIVRLFAFAVLTILAAPCFSQNVGIGTFLVNASALLELNSANQGFLIPRMTSAQKLAVVAPATGDLVYDASLVTFYYYNGVAWVPIISTLPGWLLTGNAATVASTNFLGTIDSVDLVLRTNNFMRGAVTATGNVGFGTTAPTSILHTIASGAKAADYTGNLLTNIATKTSLTTNIKKYGLEVLSTGSWLGANAINVGLHVNATGGTNNYSAVLQGGNVGVNTTTPNTYLDVSGDMATRYGTYTAASGSNNDIAVGAVSFARITGPTAAFSITGVSGGVDGKLLTLLNSTSQPFTISNESSSSQAANRIWTLSDLGDITISSKGAVDLIYSAADSRWIVITSSTTVSTSTTGTITRKKAVDQSIVSTASLVNDPELIIPIPANDSMQFEAYLDMKTPSGGKDAKVAVTVPSGATLNFVSFSTKVGAVDEYFLKSSGVPTGVIDFNTNNFENGILLFGTVTTGATGGNVQLQYTQAASSSVPNVFKAGSYFEGTYIRK